jgi:hypothetical protein
VGEDEADDDAGHDGGRPEHARHRRVLGLDRPETHPTISFKNRLHLQQTCSCFIGLKPGAYPTLEHLKVFPLGYVSAALLSNMA